MRIIVIGGTGTIGSAVVKELSARHEVLIAGRKSVSLPCDILSEDSIRSMYIKAGKFDAVVIASGSIPIAPFQEMTSLQYRAGLDSKLMGQLNSVLIGKEYIQDAGSFTLTSGILVRDPVHSGSAASMVNGAVEGFVVGSSIEMPRQMRINVIRPTILVESIGNLASYFRGFDPVPGAKVALAYSKSVEGHQTGQIYEVLG